MHFNVETCLTDTMFKRVSTLFVVAALLGGTVAINHSLAATKKAPKKVVYKNCKEARKAGVTPIYKGQPGYSLKLDRDKDGIACE